MFAPPLINNLNPLPLTKSTDDEYVGLTLNSIACGAPLQLDVKYESVLNTKVELNVSYVNVEGAASSATGPPNSIIVNIDCGIPYELINAFIPRLEPLCFNK